MLKSISEYDLPVGVEVRHLMALEAVAQTGSFSQAATRLGYAQSAISQQISTLEKAVGHRLVDRPGGPRSVSLTEAGKVLLDHAGHIVARLAAAKADLDAMAAGDAGSTAEALGMLGSGLLSCADASRPRNRAKAERLHKIRRRFIETYDCF